MQKGISFSTIIQHTEEYLCVGFYTSKIQCKTAESEMSAFQGSNSPGLNPISGIKASLTQIRSSDKCEETPQKSQ